jgi:hypothetical protein
VAAVSRPQVIDDEQHERIHDRVAAVDVAKDAGVVCTRTPHPSRPGARRSTVWTVKARMNAVRALGRQLRKDGIEIVTLESTSDYWRIWFFVLEACGLVVQLVNAAQARNLPGRPKTDSFSELRGQRCSSGGCPATAADCHHVRKVQFGRSITVWPRPEHYRKRTYGAEPAAQILLAAARYVSLSRRAGVCPSP